MDIVFRHAWTLNEDNEVGFPGLPVYVTQQEIGLCMVAVMFSYGMLIPVLGTGLVTMACVLAIGLVSIHRLAAHRSTLPPTTRASWLWDARLAWGLIPTQRGLVQAGRRPLHLSGCHIAQPSPFLSGARQAGADLSIAAAGMLACPPVLGCRTMRIPQASWQVVDQPAAPPAWADGCAPGIALSALSAPGRHRPRPAPMPMGVLAVLRTLSPGLDAGTAPAPRPCDRAPGTRSAPAS